MKDLFVFLLKHSGLLMVVVVVMAVMVLLIGAALSEWKNARSLRKWRREHERSATGNYRDTDF